MKISGMRLLATAAFREQLRFSWLIAGFGGDVLG